MRRVLNDNFTTEIGTIESWIETNDIDKEFVVKGHYVTTKGHAINLEIFEIENEWLPDTMKIEASRGWRWHIKKINDQTERLTIYCKMIDPTDETKWGSETGQFLDAFEIENKTK